MPRIPGRRASASAGGPSGSAVLVRARDLGGHDDPAPRPALAPARVLRWARPALLPVSSLMRVETTDPVVALTYDDGPDPAHTPGVMAALAERGVTATFFLLARSARQHPSLVADLLAAGHEIGLHGWDHALLAEQPPWRAVRAIRDSAAALEQVAGQAVTMYRPTYGIQGWSQYLAARALGMDVVFWSAWAQDWLDDDESVIAGRALRAAHPGAVLLLHDTTGDADTSGLPYPRFSRAGVTARVVDGLHERGYAVRTVGALTSGHRAVRAVTLGPPLAGLRPRRLAAAVSRSRRGPGAPTRP